jgi:hypothetical protein
MTIISTAPAGTGGGLPMAKDKKPKEKAKLQEKK